MPKYVLYDERDPARTLVLGTISRRNRALAEAAVSALHGDGVSMRHWGHSSLILQHASVLADTARSPLPVRENGRVLTIEEIKTYAGIVG